jgi:hypothetical protein
MALTQHRPHGALAGVRYDGLDGGPQVIAVPAGAHTWTGFAPIVTAGGAVTIDVPKGNHTWAGFAPTVSTPRTVAVPAGSHTWSGFAPTVVAPQVVAVPNGSHTWAGLAPTVSTPRTIAVPAGSHTWNALAPTVSTPRTVAVPAGTHTWTGFAPTVSTGGAQVIQVPAGTHTWAGFAPTVIGIAVSAGRRAAGRRSYIIKGKRYHLTNNELAYLLGHLEEEERRALIRAEVLVTYKDKKAHPVSKSAWAEIQDILKRHEPNPIDDDEEAAMLLL